MTFPSIYYFFTNGAFAFMLPFLVIYYQSRGMTGAQVGVLTALSPLIGMVGAPLWNSAADATHRHKTFQVISMLGLITLAFIFPQTTTFAGLLLVLILFALFGAPGAALVDSAVMALLGERRGHFGRIRFWGTVGYGIVAPLASIWVGGHGLSWAFWGYAGLNMVSLLSILPMPFRQSRSENTFFKGMRTLLTSRRWMTFLVMVFIAGIGMITVNAYLFVYLKSLGASSALMGSALTISVITELPIMFFSDRLLRRFGARGMLIIGMAVIGLRLVAYFLVVVPWVVLLIQLTHGLTFAVIYTAGVNLADQIAPPGLKATAQGMFAGTFYGVGAATGSFLGGALLDSLSPSGMYGVIGTIVLVGLVLILLVERFLAAKRGYGGPVPASGPSTDQPEGT